MLSKRLYEIAKLVNKDSVVADIGSDHALLPCYLVKENIVKKAYAIDNKKDPLQASVENINKYGLEDKVEAILADGLDNLSSDVTSVVIAGMGFMTIEGILETNIKKVLNLSQVIVQSNTEIEFLRKWIMDKNYLIEDEVIVKDNDKYYFIINFNPEEVKTYKEDSHYISSQLISEKNTLYIDYLASRVSKLENIYQFKNDSNIKNEIDLINNILKKQWF